MSFKEHLLEAIDEGLSVLGESGKKVVYYYLEKNFKIKKQDIPNKIDKFADAIEKIFGDGANILEIRIMKCLFKKIGYTFKKCSKRENLTFVEYIAAAKPAMNNVGKRKPAEHKSHAKRKKKIMCVQAY